MLSVASLSSAAQAGSYYTSDNYYTAGEARETSQWAGEGARAAGLEGHVDVSDFERALKGEIPDGEKVGSSDPAQHRPGMDMTFSAPKSLSLLAYVGGDERLLGANLEAVRATLKWAEKTLAEARVRENGAIRIEKTGRLIVALFQHDTNRNLDPQAHVHAVIANLTQTADGKWRALHNDQLWKQNSLLGAIYHSFLRERVERLGYQTEISGKHGQFEIKGVERDAIDAFSTRRQDILAKAGELGIARREGLLAVALRTRPSKQMVEDRGALHAAWQERAQSIGLDLAPVVAAARAQSERSQSPVARIVEGLRGAGDYVAALFGVAKMDPRAGEAFYLAPNRSAGREGVAAAVGVAAAIRHLSERETSFTRFDIARAALHLGIGTTIDRIEAQISRLERRGILIFGQKDGRFTTAEGIRTEQRIIDAAIEGRGQATPIVKGLETAGARVQERAMALRGITLNPGQEGAARLLLASPDRLVNVQGVAGAGKSSVIAPVAAIAAEEGRNVLGLGVQNKLVAQLRNDTGIEAVTVARFLATHGGLLSDKASPDRLALARQMFRGAVLLVDEASMLSNSQAERLARLANRLEVGRLAFIGDARQLGAVEAGKPFEVLQQSEATATIDRNVRARSDYLQAAAQAANAGRIGDAFEALRDRVRETPDAMARSAVSDWLARPPGERETTLIMTSGRRLMADVNQGIQAGLLAEGALGSRGIETIVRDRVHVTREELRHWRTYATGMIVEVRAGPAARAIGLEAGDYRVTGIDQRTGKVRLEDERKREAVLKPEKLPKRADDAIRLAEERRMALHEGEKIRWTDNDKDRGLLNADVARILGIDGTGVKIRNAQGIEMMLAHGDPMLKRLDLAYAMNTHQLQGATANQVIAVADSRETNLNTARLFLVNVTRPREELTLYVDSAERYARNLARNAGDKTSALETVGLVQLPPREAIVKPAVPQVEPARSNDKQPPVRERQLELGR